MDRSSSAGRSEDKHRPSTPSPMDVAPGSAHPADHKPAASGFPPPPIFAERVPSFFMGGQQDGSPRPAHHVPRQDWPREGKHADRPVQIHVRASAAAPGRGSEVMDIVLALVRAGQYTDAVAHFLRVATGPGATPERCAELFSQLAQWDRAAGRAGRRPLEQIRALDEATRSLKGGPDRTAVCGATSEALNLIDWSTDRRETPSSTAPEGRSAAFEEVLALVKRGDYLCAADRFVQEVAGPNAKAEHVLQQLNRLTQWKREALRHQKEIAIQMNGVALALRDGLKKQWDGAREDGARTHFMALMEAACRLPSFPRPPESDRFYFPALRQEASVWPLAFETERPLSPFLPVPNELGRALAWAFEQALPAAPRQPSADGEDRAQQKSLSLPPPLLSLLKVVGTSSPMVVAGREWLLHQRCEGLRDRDIFVLVPQMGQLLVDCAAEGMDGAALRTLAAMLDGALHMAEQLEIENLAYGERDWVETCFKQTRPQVRAALWPAVVRVYAPGAKMVQALLDSVLTCPHPRGSSSDPCVDFGFALGALEASAKAGSRPLGTEDLLRSALLQSRRVRWSNQQAVLGRLLAGFRAGRHASLRPVGLAGDLDLIQPEADRRFAAMIGAHGSGGQALANFIGEIHVSGRSHAVKQQMTESFLVAGINNFRPEDIPQFRAALVGALSGPGTLAPRKASVSRQTLDKDSMLPGFYTAYGYALEPAIRRMAQLMADTSHADAAHAMESGTLATHLALHAAVIRRELDWARDLTRRPDAEALGAAEAESELRSLQRHMHQALGPMTQWPRWFADTVQGSAADLQHPPRQRLEG